MNGSGPLGDRQAQYPDTVRQQNPGEALRPSSPPSSPSTHMEGERGEGTAVSHGPSGSGGSGGAGPPPSTAAASDLSRVSGDSHHSYHSQRSRWSSAATVATTVAPTQRYNDAAPEHEALQEEAELSGGSSSGHGRRHGLLLPVGAAGPSGTRSTAAGVSAARSGASSSGRASLAAGTDLLHAAAAAAREGGARSAAAASSGSGGTNGRLPPRLIVFHPDGSDFSIAVDPLRAKQLERAADAAAQQRRRQAQQQRATAVAALGPPGVRPAAGALPQDEGYDANFPGWRQSYMRQKYALIGVLVLDVVYLAVLLALRLVWGKQDSEPQLSGAAKFFVGRHPATTSVSFLAGSMFTDLIALYGTVQDYPSVLTLFIVWSVVLGAFAILEMPLLFVVMRLLLLVAAFQLRLSMARVRSMLPPSSLGGFFSGAGRGLASAGGATWGAVTRPFRGRGRLQEQGETDHEAQQGAASVAMLQRQSLGAIEPSSPPGPASAQLAAARSSALFRAAVLRMMSDQQQNPGQPAERDLEVGVPSSSISTAAADGRRQPSGSSSSTDRREQRRSSSGAMAAVAAGPAELAGSGGSLDRLYSSIMEDIAAVAATPAGSSSSSARRRQRRHERDSLRRTLAAASSSRSTGTRRSQRADSSASSASSDDDAPSGSGRAQAIVASGSAAGPGSAVNLPVAAAQRQAAPGGAPSWQDLVLLLSYHQQQQQARRQWQQEANVVPLVCLEAPSPPPSQAPGSADASGGAAGAGQPAET